TDGGAGRPGGGGYSAQGDAEAPKGGREGGRQVNPMSWRAALMGLVSVSAMIGYTQPPQTAPVPHSAAQLPKAPGPLSPKEERETFRLPEGFTIDLVACEPDVVDPVAMCFDAQGRLFVCEMRGYPNGGVGTGNETRGKIKCFTDTRGTGTFDRCVTFADGLRFPMGITPYKNGLLVAVAPDLIYL